MTVSDEEHERLEARYLHLVLACEAVRIALQKHNPRASPYVQLLDSHAQSIVGWMPTEDDGDPPWESEPGKTMMEWPAS